MTERKWLIDAKVASDVGCQREQNEDHIVFFKPEDPDVLREKGIVAVVADGMGGHMAGSVASELAVEIVRRVYYEEPREATAALTVAFQRANQEINHLALSDKAYHGMGTTCTALVVGDTHAFCAHVGDSRLYLIRNGEIRLLTEDHSIVWEMVKAGVITPEEAINHPNRNMISRAIGAKPSVDVFSWKNPIELRELDTFVLCSDGLYGLVQDEEIKSIATQHHDLDTVCADCISLAKARGGFDNISVGLIRLTPC